MNFTDVVNFLKGFFVMLVMTIALIGMVTTFMWAVSYRIEYFGIAVLLILCGFAGHAYMLDRR